MNIAIIDDMESETAGFRDAVKEYSAINRLDIDIRCFGSAEEFLADYAPLKYTVIILDIYMKEMTGLEAAKLIKEQDKDALIVFLSSSSDHFPDALRLHAYDFINKPTDKERVFGLLDDIFRQKTEICSNLIFTSSKETLRMPYSVIAAVCANGHYCDVTDGDGALYNAHISYSSAAASLAEDSRFLEINRGVIVNMDMITEFDKEGCRLSNGMNFSLNVRRRRELVQTWQNYTFAVLRNETIRRK